MKSLLTLFAFVFLGCGTEIIPVDVHEITEQPSIATSPTVGPVTTQEYAFPGTEVCISIGVDIPEEIQNIALEAILDFPSDVMDIVPDIGGDCENQFRTGDLLKGPEFSEYAVALVGHRDNGQRSASHVVIDNQMWSEDLARLNDGKEGVRCRMSDAVKHEIVHWLGHTGHSDDPSSLMYNLSSPGCSGYTKDAIQSLTELYGQKEKAPTSP